MTQPLAFLVYEKLLPGSQLANRLRDLGYRVQNITEIEVFPELAEAQMPMVAVVDLVSTKIDTCDMIRRLRSNPSTAHIPVLAFAGAKNVPLQNAARDAGATLVAVDDGILHQLPTLLEQALEVE